MFDKIEKVKLGKLDPTELLKNLSNDSGSNDASIKVKKTEENNKSQVKGATTPIANKRPQLKPIVKKEKTSEIILKK